MTNKATKYGLMIIAAVLLVAMAFAGAGAAIDGTPVELTGVDLTNYKVLVVDNLTGAVNPVSADTLAGGKTVYLLEDAEDWNAVAIDSSYDDIVLILGDNLEFSEIDNDYKMTNLFVRNIYGNGYLIKNFTNTSGLIDKIGNNIYLNYIQLTNSTCSLISSISGSNVTVIGCSVINGSITSSSGGIIGGFYGTENNLLIVNHTKVLNSTISRVDDDQGDGILIGRSEKGCSIKLNNCNATDCWLFANTRNVGGLIGYSTNSFFTASNCIVKNCTIIATGKSLGGLAGRVNPSDIISGGIMNCEVLNCNITGTENVGGLVGFFKYGAMNNCTALNCNVTCSGMYVGGLIGAIWDNLNTVEKCVALSCNVKGTDSTTTGGILGGESGIFKDCIAGTTDAPVYLSPHADNDLNGTDATATMTDCYANITDTPFDLQFPTKEEIQVFPASKLPYVYVTYNAAPGVAGSPYSSAKQTVDMPYKRNTTFGSIVSGNSVSPICLGYDLTDWDRAATGNVVSNEVVAADWIIHEYNITYNNMTGATNLEANPATYNITSSEITLENAYKIGYTFENWYNSSVFGDASRNNTIPAGSTGDKVFYANWTVNTTDVTASDHKAEFHKDNITAIHSTTGIVTKVLLENVSNVDNSAVNFTADNTSVGEIPGVAGYLKDEITIFDLNASAIGTAKINVTVTFANETIANATKDNIRFFHYNVSVWEPLNSTIASQTGAKVLYTVETTSFSPFGIGILTPITYTVHFNANGGQGSMADMTFTYDQAQNLTANAFQRYNSNFLYWTCNGNKYYNNAFVQNLTTVDGYTVEMVAQWEGYSTGGSSSGSTYMGSSSASYTPTQQATVKPTVAPTAAPTEKPATPTVIATEKPTTQPTQQSPAPFVGLLAGLGVATVVLRLRK